MYWNTSFLSPVVRTAEDTPVPVFSEGSRPVQNLPFRKILNRSGVPEMRPGEGRCLAAPAHPD